MINRDRALQTFMEIVQIDSVSKNERKMADYLIEHFTALGYTVIEDLVSKAAIPDATAGNIIVKVPGNGAGEKLEPLLLCAHIDTVEPGVGIKPQTSPDGTYIISDGTTILGGDDKGGVAQIIELVHVLKEQNISHQPLELLFTVCEEIRLLGSRALDVTLVEAKQAYVLDGGPETGDVLVGGPTVYDVSGTITGRSAHAGVEPDKGISSIQVLGHAIAQMNLLKVDEETTCNIGYVSTDYPYNVVPEQTHFGFEVRSLNGKKADAQLQHMIDIIEAQANQFGAKAIFNVAKVLTAYKIERDNPVLRHYYTVCAENGIEVRETISRGGTDLSSLIEHGIDGIVIATGGDNIHTTHERLSIDIFQRSLDLLIKLITIK